MLYIAINVAIFLLVVLINLIGAGMGYGDLLRQQIDYYLAFPSTPWLWPTHFYTVLTYQFMHDGFFHLLFNMLWLYLMGPLLLDFIKSRQFHFIYLIGGICGAIFFALTYNFIPFFKSSIGRDVLVGASASVMAIFTALATLVPNYNLRLMFIGNIRIKYLFLIYFLINILDVFSSNAGGSIAHLGGALFGFIYIKILQNGTDISAIFKKKPKLRVVKNENPKPGNNVVNQKEIDAILDKISKTGYDKLSKTEKDTLFKASKN
jgi:membrane associated rhomboid family serine protease